jgi:hypothetical protein
MSSFQQLPSALANVPADITEVLRRVRLAGGRAIAYLETRQFFEARVWVRTLPRRRAND